MCKVKSMDEQDESSVELRQESLKAWGQVCVALSWLLGLAAALTVIYMGFGLMRSAVSQPEGIPLRQMGVAYFFFQLGIVSFIFGLPPRVLGTMLCEQAHYEEGVRWAKRSTLLHLSPLIAAFLLFLLTIVFFGAEAAK